MLLNSPLTAAFEAAREKALAHSSAATKKRAAQLKAKPKRPLAKPKSPQMAKTIKPAKSAMSPLKAPSAEQIKSGGGLLLARGTLAGKTVDEAAADESKRFEDSISALELSGASQRQFNEYIDSAYGGDVPSHLREWADIVAKGSGATDYHLAEAMKLDAINNVAPQHAASLSGNDGNYLIETGGLPVSAYQALISQDPTGAYSSNFPGGLSRDMDRNLLVAQAAGLPPDMARTAAQITESDISAALAEGDAHLGDAGFFGPLMGLAGFVNPALGVAGGLFNTFQGAVNDNPLQAGGGFAGLVGSGFALDAAGNPIGVDATANAGPGGSSGFGTSPADPIVTPGGGDVINLQGVDFTGPPSGDVLFDGAEVPVGVTYSPMDGYVVPTSATPPVDPSIAADVLSGVSTVGGLLSGTSNTQPPPSTPVDAGSTAASTTTPIGPGDAPGDTGTGTGDGTGPDFPDFPDFPAPPSSVQYNQQGGLLRLNPYQRRLIPGLPGRGAYRNFYVMPGATYG